MSKNLLPADQVAALAKLLEAPRRAVIITHHNPDGDAVGSALGLARVLKAAGHQTQVVWPNPAPGNLRWMQGHAEAINHTDHQQAAERTVRTAEVLFCLDFNRADRVYALEEALRAATVKVLIDHHREPENIFDIAFSDITASSTCQLVHDVVAELGLDQHIDPEAAACLYAGIMTDTGSFRFPSTTPHTHRVAAHLLERGARPQTVYEAIMEDNTLDRLQLTGFALYERLRVLLGGEATLVALSKGDLERFHFAPGDTEGLVNYGLSIRGVRLAAFLVERADGIKISLRSKGPLPVNEFLATHFQGGGHANAAGGRSTLGMEATVEKLTAELPLFLAQHPA
ncbi:MAG TPA: DHH family phosphoesterase [Flavobacteriales bacterium]|nr:DHH family phosphoesterase [Flavobacteriales bacterium]